MKNQDIIFFVIAFAALSFSLYRKYIKKNQAGRQDGAKVIHTGSLNSVKDDYEPYKGK